MDTSLMWLTDALTFILGLGVGTVIWILVDYARTERLLRKEEDRIRKRMEERIRRDKEAA